MPERWLRSIGLEKHVSAFLAERVALADLAQLTEADLRELGLPIGDRRRFRRAVLEGALQGGTPDPRPAGAPHRLVQEERRALTVMFVDIVGFMDLGHALDDEEVLSVLRSFRTMCGAAISRTGGHVAKFLGDGIMAYFCYPVAHENDPQRAVRAALEITASAGGIHPRPGQELAVRIGIATGSVILSSLNEGGEADRHSVTGTPPNLAARLQAIAPPGGVVIGPATHDRVAHLFPCTDLGFHQIKGLREPVQCWQVLGEATRRDQANAVMPVRGRELELQMLDLLWRNTIQHGGGGNVALIRGEAGVGKSALLGEFIRRHGLPDETVVTLCGSSLDCDTPFFPVASYLRAGTAHHPQDQAAALVAKVAGLPFDAAQLDGLSLPQQRDRTLEALADLLLGKAGDHPICLVVEDLHWLDPSTIELLSRLLDRLDHVPALLLMTARSEFASPWQDHDRITTLVVGRLRKEEIRAMTVDLLGTANIPAAMLARVVERTDGVPLFVQEVIRRIGQGQGKGPGGPAMSKSGSSDWGDPYGDDVPSSLQEALMGRLDRARDAKEVAQIASVIGRRLDRALLLRVAELPARELDQCLLTLVEGGVFRREGGSGDGFSFSHALLRDIAYGSLLRDTRRALHARVADALECLQPSIAKDHPAILALHLTEAGRMDVAGQLWLEAGRRALAAPALTEATRLLRRGLAAIEGLAPSAERRRLELELLGLLGPALMSLNGPGAAETSQHYERSHALCQTLQSETSQAEPAHFPLYWGWWRVSKDFHTMSSRSGWLLSRAMAQSDQGVLMQAHHCSWASAYHLGDFAGCCAHIEAGLRLYGDGDWRHHAPLYGNHDARACAHGELALVHCMQAQPGGGHRHQRHALEWAHGLRHLGSLMHNMDIALVFHAMRGDHADAYRASEELTALTIEHGCRDHESKGRIYGGWAKALREDPSGGLSMLREGFAMQEDIGTSEDFPIYVCLLAEALMAAGQPEQALTELLTARAQFERTGLRAWLPEVLRMTAAAMAASSAEARSGGSALALLETAAGVAAEQNVPMLGLRVAHDRAARLDGGGDPHAAEAILGAALAGLPAHEGAEVGRAAAWHAALRERLRLQPVS